MSVIGAEGIPNLHIEKIEVYNNHCEVTVFCLDDIEDPVWLNDLTKQHFKIMVVVTKSKDLVADLTLGQAKMDPRIVKLKDYYAHVDVISLGQLDIKERSNQNYISTKVK